MFWNKKEKSVSIEEEFHLAMKRGRLIRRTKLALKDTTDYDLRLRNFMLRNVNNQKLVLDVVAHMSYMKSCGSNFQDAAKETLEKFQH